MAVALSSSHSIRIARLKLLQLLGFLRQPERRRIRVGLARDPGDPFWVNPLQLCRLGMNAALLVGLKSCTT